MAKQSAHKRGYTKQWQRMVHLAIQAHPYCTICGTTKDLTGDHITPLSQGGLNIPNNIRVLCRPCNSTRGTKPFFDLRARRPLPRFSRLSLENAEEAASDG